jgi:hypothetical protein
MPIVTIQSPQGEEFQIEAPEGATDEQIFNFAKSQGLFNNQQPAVDGTQNPDVPTVENLAAEQSRADALPERTFAESAIGVGDAALTALTGATTGALGFGAGSISGVLGELTGRLKTGEGLEEAQALSAKLTRAPTTEAGQEFLGDIAGALGTLPPVIGATPLMTLKPLITGKPITESLLKSPRAKRALLADEIRKGNPNIESVTKALDASGEIITRPSSKRALKELGGDDAAKGTVSVIENMSKASKQQVNKMLDLIETGNKNPLFKDANRPSDILGESIANRARAVSFQNKKAGKEIGAVADSLSDLTVDIKSPIDSFVNNLTDLGVTFKRAEDGWVTPDFSRSKFVGGSQKDMNVLVNDLMNTRPDFKTAHKLKQTIRDNIDFDKGGTGQIKGASEALLKDLSRGIDDVLDGTSIKYKKANENFAKTIKLKDEFDKLAGKDIDIESDLSVKALGGKGMRLDSNAVSRVQIEQTLLRADDVLKEFGVKFKDDVPSLVHIVGKLNETFKLAPGGSLKGNIASAGLDVAEAATGNPIAVGRAAVRLAKKDAPDFNKKIRAFRMLTKTQENN